MEEMEKKGRQNAGQAGAPSTTEAARLPQDHPADLQFQGRITGLYMSPWHIVTEDELARALGRHPVTIKRAVERGELPPPVRLMGKPTWTGAVILKHLESRLEQARESVCVFNRHRT